MLIAPAGTVTLAGTVTRAPDEVEYPIATVEPPPRAAPVNVTVQVVEPGICRLDGEQESACSAGTV